MPEVNGFRKRVMVLGAGYVGRAIWSELSRFHDVLITSRSGVQTGDGSLQKPIAFDLLQPETWSNVFDVDFVVWTFPAAVSFEHVRSALEFHRRLRDAGISTLVLASTSSYLVQFEDDLIDETVELDFSQPRVRAEESLREQGCFILALAGIYGSGRDPAQWLQRGWIKSGSSYINLIHISDIVRIVEAWLRNPLQGVRLNASDGRHRRWQELTEQLKAHGFLHADVYPFSPESPRSGSKRISNDALVKELYSGPFHLYPENGLE